MSLMAGLGFESGGLSVPHALGLDQDADLGPAVAFRKVDLTDTAASIAALPEGRPVAGLVNCAGIR